MYHEIQKLIKKLLRSQKTIKKSYNWWFCLVLIGIKSNYWDIQQILFFIAYVSIVIFFCSHAKSWDYQPLQQHQLVVCIAGRQQVSSSPRTPSGHAGRRLTSAIRSRGPGTGSHHVRERMWVGAGPQDIFRDPPRTQRPATPNPSWSSGSLITCDHRAPWRRRESDDEAFMGGKYYFINKNQYLE